MPTLYSEPSLTPWLLPWVNYRDRGQALAEGLPFPPQGRRSDSAEVPSKLRGKRLRQQSCAPKKMVPPLGTGAISEVGRVGTHSKPS